MKKTLLTSYFLLLAFLGNVVAQEVDSLVLRLDSVVGEAKILRTSQMGLMVYDLDADSVVYQRDALQTLRPASTMKLLTAITALDRLGAEYEFTTRLMKTDSCDYYLIGCMDPLIGMKELNQIADSIKAQGIDTIHGSLFADRSMKDADLYGEGWCWDDDNPMLSPLVYNRKDGMMETLAELLQVRGVFFTDGIKTGTCPSGATQVCEVSHKLIDVLVPMMKNSNNLYAESVFYQLGLMRGRPSTAKKASKAIEDVLRRAGREESIHRFADGSGLSLYNYVSADIEVAFLRYAFSDKDLYYKLYETLPIAAIDGTLKDRMNGTPAAGNVRAKTGTVSGVSSLAGYCTTSGGRHLAFSIINQGVMKGSYAKALQDRLCVEMCK